ncbi:MAG: hypothetical protein KDD45_01120 [Bdellovibrionales bacterium]|nr:hypothetical protein [Bdellovibrionales bacterium]
MSECLLYLKFSILEPKDKIRTVISELGKNISIEKISSVFKRKNFGNANFANSQEFVVRGKTELTALDLNKKLSLKIQNLDTSYKIELLSYDNEIRLTPQLTLPHPQLFLDPLILHCSSEIWPEYIHPVNGDSLRKSDQESESENLEFLYQGKYFLSH